MDVRSPLMQNIALILAGVLFLNPIVTTAAQLTVDQAAAGNTVVTQAANGVPIVNIATPNGSGLSHNKFTDYNVGLPGLILNNATESLQSTQLGGYVVGNSNLKSGAAGLILNEVTGGNASQLKGYTEVAGRSAAVIVANPHGITCDGCGFINTPRVTLSTGKPIVEGGRLDRFDVEGGQISIEGAGLNAANVEQFDLITRSAKINAELYANQLNVVTGRNQVDAATLNATVKADDGSDKPLLAIDSSALGGMYAGAIRLVGTEAGVGVKLAGDMAASAGDIQIDANGHLSLARTAASRDLQLKAENIELNASAYAGRNATVQVDNLTVQDSLATGGDLAISAAQLNNQGVIEAGSLSDGATNGEAKLSLSGGSVSNRGTLLSHGRLSSDLQLLDNQDATLVSTGAASLKVQQLNNQGGSLIGQQSLSISGQQMNNQAGTLASNEALSVTLDETLDNSQDGLILSKKGGLTLSAKDVLNQNGSVQADEGELRVSAASSLNNQAGLLVAGKGDMHLSAAELDNHNGQLSANQGTLALTTDSTDNSTGDVQARALDITATTLLNNDQGRLSAIEGTQTIKAVSVQNNQGRLLASGLLDITADNLQNRDGPWVASASSCN